MHRAGTSRTSTATTASITAVAPLPRLTTKSTTCIQPVAAAVNVGDTSARDNSSGTDGTDSDNGDSAEPWHTSCSASARGGGARVDGEGDARARAKPPNKVAHVPRQSGPLIDTVELKTILAPTAFNAASSTAAWV
jgi:hypothetical protein